MWVDFANNIRPLVTDPKGKDALSSWIDAIYRYNVARANGDENEISQATRQNVENFKTIGTYIIKPELSAYFKQVADDFDALPKTPKDLYNRKMNEFMIEVFSQLKQKLGC